VPYVEVRTLFFAAYRDALGLSELAVTLPEGASVSDLVRSLRGRGTPFEVLPGDPAVAVNRRYSPMDRVLEGGDEVAFIPPVAGG
jgi:molybdopterin converting factor subunit 1